jgi:glycosyltransferase involved in cell wall biosynthesis
VTAGPTVTAAILARDEADTIGGCLGSVAWADERLVILDAATTDATAEIAATLGARVVRKEFAGFQRQRNAALDAAHGAWVLFVDADERVTPALASEVRRRLLAPGPNVGFWVPRRNVIAGVWVRHAGWWPDKQLRLLKRGSARYDESGVVHEVAELSGPSDMVSEPLLHLNYDTLAEFREKQRRYALLEARTLANRGIRARPRSLLAQPIREFRRRVFVLGGIKQGPLGVWLGLEMALASFQTYRELLRLARVQEPPTPAGSGPGEEASARSAGCS